MVKPGSRDIAGWALTAFGVIAAGVTVIAVVESYSNLLAFARAYGLSGWRAAIAPGAVDLFIIMGELLLFAAILLAWGMGPHVLGAAMAAWGFLLSVAGNVWHASAATPADRAVAAIWPVTATAGLAGALLIVRYLAAAPVPVAAAARRPRPQAKTPRRTRADRTAAAEQALLGELQALLESGKPLPSFRSLSMAETGKERSPWVKRAHDQARAGMNGGAPS